MPPISGRTTLLLLVLAVGPGCTEPLMRGNSPLSPARMSSDSVVVEVFRVRCPFGDPQANAALWAQVDEQHFPPEVRGQLTKNGFRVGLVGGQVPMPLSKLMQLDDTPAAANQGTQVTVDGMQEEPRVQRKHMTLRAGARGEIVTSDVYDQLPVLISKAGELGGKTFNQAQGVLAVKAKPLSDGRVELELTPELHHDQPQQRWVGNQGMLRLDTSRPRQIFDEMQITSTLSPGEMILIGSLPNRPGSLGHYFLTRDKGKLEQELLVVRLSQTQHQDMFSPELALDE